MLKRLFIVLAIVITFAALKSFAPEIVSIMPEWLKSMIILVVLVGVVTLFWMRLIRSRNND